MTGIGRRRLIKYSAAGLLTVAAASAGFLVGRYGQSVDEAVKTLTETQSQFLTETQTDTLTTTEHSFIKQRFQSQGAVIEHNPNIYDSDQARKVVDHLLDLHFNWIMLKSKTIQESLTSSDVRFQDPRHAEALTSLTKYAKDAGMDVGWLPVPEVPYVEWAGNFNPSDVNAWFESYGSIIKELAAAASKSDVSLLMLGQELNRLENHEANWQKLISQVRALYSGSVSYDITGWTTRSGLNGYERLVSTNWFKELDYFGSSAFFGLTDKNDPSIDEIEKGWLGPYKGDEQSATMPSIVDSYQRLSEYTGKPIIFTSVGYRSVSGGNKEPANYLTIPNSDNSVDFEEQSDCFEALFRALSDKPWWRGLFVWDYPTDVALGGGTTGNEWFDSKSFTPLNKPAENVISRWFTQD